MAPHVVSSTSVRAAAPASLALSAAHATRPARRLAARSAAGSASPGGAARLALSSGALPRRPRRSENASRTLVGVSSRELDELRESLAPLRSLDASADSADGLCRTHFVAETSLPTAHGVFRVRAYRHTVRRSEMGARASRLLKRGCWRLLRARGAIPSETTQCEVEGAGTRWDGGGGEVGDVRGRR